MRRINAFVSSLGGGLVLVLVILLTISFVSRILEQTLTIGVINLVAFCMVAIVFLGFSRCEEVKGHVRVDVLLIRLSPDGQRSVKLAIYALEIVIVGLLTYVTGLQALTSWQQNEMLSGLMDLILWPVKTVLFIGFALYFVQVVLSFIDVFRRAPEVREKAITHE